MRTTTTIIISVRDMCKDTLEKMGEFWDTHDFTDFDDPNAPDIEFDVSCAVPIEEELFTLLEN